MMPHTGKHLYGCVGIVVRLIKPDTEILLTWLWLLNRNDYNECVEAGG